MHSYFLYQQTDTSQAKKQEKKDSVVSPQMDTFPIDLMEEIDEVSIKEVVKPKNQDILTFNNSLKLIH